MRTLSEDYFIEVLGFKSAGALGRGVGAQFSDPGKKLRNKITANRLANPGQTVGQTMKNTISNPETANLAKQAGQTTAAAVGGTAGQLALGGAYVGAAYLAYKGLMKLKDRFSKSNKPQEKEHLQKQIDQGQSKLQRAKELQANKKKQASEKRQN